MVGNYLAMPATERNSGHIAGVGPTCITPANMEMGTIARNAHYPDDHTRIQSRSQNMTETIKIETNEEERKDIQHQLRAELAKLDMPTDQELLVSLLRNGRTSGHDQR